MARLSLALASLGILACAPGCLDNEGSSPAFDGGLDAALPQQDATLPDAARDASLVDQAAPDANDAASAGDASPDAKLEAGTDASVDAAPDATAQDAGTDAGVVAGTDAGPPIAHVRFIHAAPDAAPLDVCVKLSSDLGYPPVPLFREAGSTAGFAFGQISRRFDFAPEAFYDLLFVEAATTTCDPPHRAFIGNRLLQGLETLTVYETQFTPVAGFNTAQFFDVGSPTAGSANVRFFYAANGGTGSADLLGGLVGAPAPTTWFSGVESATSTGYHATVPGTYTIQVNASGSGASLATAASVALAADAPVDAFLYPSATGQFGLLRCPATPLAASAFTAACTP
jgi:hypothetical protein